MLVMYVEETTSGSQNMYWSRRQGAGEREAALKRSSEMDHFEEAKKMGMTLSSRGEDGGAEQRRVEI